MSKPKTKSLPVCTCGHICRFYRSAIGSATEWRCTYCERTYSKTEALSLYPAIEVEEPTFTTDNAPIMQMFKAAPQVMAAPMPVPIVTASPVAVAPIEPPIKNEPLYPDLVTDTSVPDTEVWTPSFNENAIDVNEIFSYHHGKDEKRTSPQRMAMPAMQVSARRAEAPTFDTGRNQYSLRSER